MAILTRTLRTACWWVSLHLVTLPSWLSAMLLTALPRVTQDLSALCRPPLDALWASACACVHAVFFTWNSWKLPGQAERHLLREVFLQQPERGSHSVLRAAIALLPLPVHAWWTVDGRGKMTNSQPLLSRSSPQTETEMDSYKTFTLCQCV